LIRGRLWPVVRDLRGGFVLRPGAITVALGAIAIILTKVEERITPIGTWSDFLDRLFPPEPEAAHVVLGTIAGSKITVVAVVYSILLVAFVKDRVSQTRLGLFVGTFTYCLLTLPAVFFKEAVRRFSGFLFLSVSSEKSLTEANRRPGLVGL
jgi:uncharacterized membrane protein